ncbi:hypothetical protein [Candidatus Tokpelaia sp.]|uniref:hypothetical protein n=1 Tax=Candidatus Tokpelaia sp. TaxID=2233777 RepID=UPI00123C103F|nr:hypothetical protein [Candidatus Tokpelaia sp.]KAA6404780.1 hypothetical protein DPQ22_07590 [Candidatus Tokpelaia sp.]
MPNEQNETKTPTEAADNRQKTVKRKTRSRLKRFFYAIILIIIGLAAGFAFMVKSDLAGDFLDGKVQAALRKKIGAFADINIADVGLSLDKNYHIALEMKNTPITPHDSNIELSRLGRLRFGLATMPLLRRQVQPIQLEADKAAVLVHKADNQQNLFAALPQDDRQRVDFDAVAELAFRSLEQMIGKIDATKINIFHFSNIDFTISGPQNEQKFSVQYFRLRRLRDSVDIEAKISWLGQLVGFSASAAVDKDGRVQNFAAAADNLPLRFGAADNETPYLAHGRTRSSFFRLRGAANVTISGAIAANGKKTLSATTDFINTHSDIAVETGIVTKFTFAAGYEQGSGQIMVQPSVFAIGGLEIPFSGQFGYLPAAGVATEANQAAPVAANIGNGQYGFRLKAEKALSSPADSPAEALPFNLETGGRFLALEKKLNLDNIALKTAEAALLGNGSLRFGEQGSPETIFILHTANMPVDEAKQLWPINVARSGRAWVLSHIFGGNLTKMQIEIALPEGFYQKGKLPPLITAKELRLTTGIENTRTDLVGTLPPLREAYGQVQVTGRNTTVNLTKALAYVEDGQKINVANGQMTFIWKPGAPLWADMTMNIGGTIGAMGKLLECQPVNAAQKVPFNMQTAKGELQTVLKMGFPLHKQADYARAVIWKTDIRFRNFSLGEPFRGTMQIANANGRAQIDERLVQIDGDTILNGLPATISIRYPLGGSAQAGKAANEIITKKEQVAFHFDDKLRHKLFPALDIFLQGAITANVGEEQAGKRHASVDLTPAIVQIPWIGWKKGSGIAAKAEMSLPADGSLKNMDINDFVLSGSSFQLSGKIKIRDGEFIAADFDKFDLNRTDRLALSIVRIGKTYQVKINGSSFDLRAIVKSLAESTATNNTNGLGVALTGTLDNAQGFYGENLRSFRVIYNHSSTGDDNIMVNAVSKTQAPLKAQLSKQKGLQRISVSSDDAGAFLRFMNYYDKVQGGKLESKLQSGAGNVLNGSMHMRDFAIVNEPKLAALVSADKSKKGKKSRGGSTSLAIEQAYGRLTKGPNYLTIDNGVIRGASLGATFQGVVYDAGGNIAVTGTYMPAYSVNRLFGDVPLLGSVLGNGRDKGLIGITFKVEGKFKSPKIIVNPVSALAPGILRSIFEFKQQAKP